MPFVARSAKLLEQVVIDGPSAHDAHHAAHARGQSGGRFEARVRWDVKETKGKGRAGALIEMREDCENYPF